MPANNNMGWMVAGLVGLGAAGAGGWSMYYLERQAHDASVAQLTAEMADQQRGIDSTAGQLDSKQADQSEQRTEATNAEHEDLVRERDALRERLTFAETEQVRLIEEREELAKNLELIRTEHDQLSKELESTQTVRAQLRSDLEGAQTALDRITAELGDKIQTRERELTESTNRVEDINFQLLEASGRIDNLEQERAEIQSRFSELRDQLESDLQSKDVEIEQLKGDMTVIRLASDILFDPGSAALKDGGRDALAAIAEALNEFPDRHISLEGHTDSVPISERLQDVYATNWELSTARAARAVRYLQLHGVNPERIRAVGYGQYRPVADNDDPAVRALNRRLEILLLPANQEVREHVLSSN